jgi:hypothetical protein
VLTDAEVDSITAGTINLGDDNTGDVTVSAPIQHAGDANLVLTSGHWLTVNSSLTSVNGNVTLAGAAAASVITPGSVTTTNGNITLRANEQAVPNPNAGLAAYVSGLVTTQSGAILIQGRGGPAGSTDSFTPHSGIEIFSGARIVSTGTGTITLVGQGAPTTTTGTSFGIAIGSFVSSQVTQIQSAGGAIQITGTGGGAPGFAGNSTGVTFLDYAQVNATGSAAVTITGTAGSVSTAAGNDGVSSFGSFSGSPTQVTAADGPIQITGTGGNGPTSHGVAISHTTVQSTGSGSVTVTGTGGGPSGTGVYLQGATVGNAAAANVTLAGTGSGAADIQFDTLTLTKTGGTYTFDGAVQGTTLTANAGAYGVRFLNGGSLANPVTFNNTGNVQVGDAAGHGILSTGNVSLRSGNVYTAALAGETAGSGYGQLNVTGTVNLGGATLNLTGGLFTPTAGAVYTLINNDGTDLVTGTFNGLPEGTLLTVGNFVGRLSYAGGDGNDVTLTVPATRVSLDGSGNLVVQDISGGKDDTLTVQSDTAHAQFVISDPNNTLVSTVAGSSGSGSHVVTVPFAAVTGPQIIVDTQGGDDALTVDRSLGEFAPQIVFHGGTQATALGDRLSVAGPDLASLSYAATGPGAGSLSFGGTAAVLFDGVEPVTVASPAAALTIAVADGLSHGVTLSAGTGAGTNTATLDGGLSPLTFANPPAQLTVNADAGSDTVTFAALDAGFHAAVAVHGSTGSADQVTLNTPLNLNGALTIDGAVETTALNAGVTATSVNVQSGTTVVGAGVTVDTSAANGGITFGGAVNDSAADAHVLTLNAGAGRGRGRHAAARLHGHGRRHGIAPGGHYGYERHRRRHLGCRRGDAERQPEQ